MSFKITRRDFFRRMGIFFASIFALQYKYNEISKVFAGDSGALKSARPGGPPFRVTEIEPIPTRVLGKTEIKVTSFGLGGEGILWTYGRMREAVAVINKALDLGVTYFDTAPAYSQSQDYYGEAIQGRRKDIFLASKTHDRTRDGSLRLLEDSLRRLQTDHLDLWQFHDLRTAEDLDAIFSKGGVLEAAQEAKAKGLIRFIGITGHYNPQILLEAMRRFSFDTVMCSVNAGDVHYLPSKDTVIPEARNQNMGIIAMKVLARGNILIKGGIETAEQAISYVLNLPVSVVIIGCNTPEEVEENVRIVKTFQGLSEKEMERLESLTERYFWDANYFKAQ